MSADSPSPATPVVLACVLPELPSPAEAEAFLRFSPRIALRRRPPHAVLLDLRGLTTHDSRQILELKLRVTLTRLGIARPGLGPPIRLGWGRSPPEALTHALMHNLPSATQDSDLPLTAESIDWILDPFGLQDEASTSLHDWVLKLGALGIRTQAAFAKLPLPALGSRFGRAGVELARRLQEGRELTTPELWPVFQPPERLIEAVAFDPDQEVPAAQEPILFAARAPLDRLCLRLKARARRVSVLILRLEIRNRTHATTLTLSQPQGSSTGLLPILQEHLKVWASPVNPQGLARLFSPDPTTIEIAVPPGISGLELEALETVPGASAQRDLFDRIDELSESWDSLIGRLQQRLGPSAAFVALPTRQHLPEEGWRAQPPGNLPHPPPPNPTAALRVRNPEPDSPTRPSRILKRTVPLAIESGFLQWPENRPGTRPRRLEVLSHEGPELVMTPVRANGANGSSSKPCPEIRRYYKVRCQEGRLLWVYSTDEGPFDSLSNVQLQGYFD